MRWFASYCLIFFSMQLGAQSLRDPTLPPSSAGLGVATAPGALMVIQPGSMTIIVRNGQPLLVVGTRLYAQGQSIGEARIERISETEVWLREGDLLRKVSQFQGVQRRMLPSIPTFP
jgi:hypothetical protein